MDWLEMSSPGQTMHQLYVCSIQSYVQAMSMCSHAMFVKGSTSWLFMSISAKQTSRNRMLTIVKNGQQQKCIKNVCSTACGNR